MVYITEIWKSAGWSAIIYMAAISGIDQEQYEAAQIDGATRLQRMWYISLPGIKSTIIVMFIMAVGYIMNAGFDQIFNISNAATAKVAETLDMYIYRVTFQASADFSFSSAVSLFKSIINFVLLLTADRVSKWIGGEGLFA
jgi:putative aldouronate transport system permease protein